MPSPSPSNVSATLINSIEDNHTPSSWYSPLIRVYQTDGQNTSELGDIANDLGIMMDNILALTGYKIEIYETDITGYLECIANTGCNPYQYGRDVVYELGHWKDGGGNVFIHPNDNNDSANEGGTYSGTDYNNHVSMPYEYNGPRYGPISIKGSETRDSYCRNRGVYWAPGHELGHQFCAPTSSWNSDYGTYFCGDDNGRKSHYLADNVTPCRDARSFNLEHHTIMAQYDRYSDCGDCTDSAAPDYASLMTSSCFDEATDDCISYVKNNF